MFEFKLTQPKEKHSFRPAINLDLNANWMIRLTSLHLYNSFSNITDENNNFEFATDFLTSFLFHLGT